ncbi:MAG: hypothetical protein ACYS1A_07660 [Planctomycetota bacterium]|jgi:hypothetical protein
MRRFGGGEMLKWAILRGPLAQLLSPLAAGALKDRGKIPLSKERSAERIYWIEKVVAVWRSREIRIVVGRARLVGWAGAETWGRGVVGRS